MIVLSLSRLSVLERAAILAMIGNILKCNTEYQPQLKAIRIAVMIENN